MGDPRILCLGEALIDFLQVNGGDDFKRQAGGAPLNVACGAAKLGASAAMITMLGRDLFGDFLERTMVEHYVDTRGVRRTDQANTALAFVALDARGERSFSFYRKPCADQLLAPAHLDDALFGPELDVFHFGSISLIAEPSAAATRAAAERARAAGAWVSYDPNLRERLWPDLDTARRTMIEAMALADIVKVSEGELHFLTGEERDEGVGQLLARGATAVVVTRGERGCSVFSPDIDPVHVASLGAEVVDTTGAGDAFVAAFLDAWVRLGIKEPRDVSDQRVAAAALRGNAAGALATTRYGAIPALPTRAELDAALG
ncbi:MAG: carbohydrate kinase [Deltaproteobacteria bacterium]|nr:carbohydrate kinase [Deltaproteobacteria bacterium]